MLRPWRLRPWRAIGARFSSLLRDEADALRQGFTALIIASFGSFLAGLTLGAIEGTLEDLPGLLLLVPAAIGMRGNIFGALGSRLGTAIQTGTFSVSRRLDTLVGQNIAASIVLSLTVSLMRVVLRRILRESLPVLAVAGLVDVIAGLAIEKRLDELLVFPALLILIPPFL